jgi:hypothetical protein
MACSARSNSTTYRLIVRHAARFHDPADGHAAPNHGEVVGMTLAADLGDACRELAFNVPVVGIGHGTRDGRWPGTAPVSALYTSGGLRHMFSVAKTLAKEPSVT